jgi:hypothetical protein
MERKKWSELTDAQRRWVAAGAAVELLLTAVALRDLVGRPATEVKGPKPLWAAACFVQPLGPPAYLLFGRRTAT